MDIDLFLHSKYQALLAWWFSLGDAGPYYAWIALGVIVLSCWFWLSYRVIRRVLGHRKFNGTWYSGQQFMALLEDIHQRERDGRILSYREAYLLDTYRKGRKSDLRALARRGGSI